LAHAVEAVEVLPTGPCEVAAETVEHVLGWLVGQTEAMLKEPTVQRPLWRRVQASRRTGGEATEVAAPLTVQNHASFVEEALL
jgi:hypothetical protein